MVRPRWKVGSGQTVPEYDEDIEERASARRMKRREEGSKLDDKD